LTKQKRSRGIFWRIILLPITDILSTESRLSPGNLPAVKVLAAAEVEEIFQVILEHKRLACGSLEEDPGSGLNWFEEFSAGGIMYHPDESLIEGLYDKFRGFG
jgi:hypothetical protein